MLLQDPHGNKFQMNIGDYQFPDLPTSTNQWDLNWLMITISIKSTLGQADFSDPALLTWEVERLLTWFESIASHKKADENIHFLEATLGFIFTRSGTGKINFRVYFCLDKPESWIPINDSVERPERNGFIDLVISPEELLNASQELATQLRRFPKREATEQ